MMNKIKINLNDLKIDFFGSAARVEHLPTGFSVIQRSNDSLIMNYTEAFLIVKARIENNSNIGLDIKTYQKTPANTLTYMNGAK